MLWRRRVSSEPWTRASFVMICTLGCAIVLLFPVISASDDLHAVSQAMEESERGFRHSHCSCALHFFHHAPLPALSASALLRVAFEHVGTVFFSSPSSLESSIASASSGRAPPCHTTYL